MTVKPSICTLAYFTYFHTNEHKTSIDLPSSIALHQNVAEFSHQ